MKTFLLLMTMAIAISAAPAITGISGQITDGEILTLTGSDFGSKSKATPLIWDNFEWGESGNSLTQNGWIGGNGGGDLSGAQKRSGKLAAHWKFSGTGNYYYHYHKKIQGSEELYASYWYYNSNSNGRIMKCSRFNTDKEYSGVPSMMFGGYGSGKMFWNFNGGSGGENPSYKYVTIPMATWVRIEMYLKLSTPAGTANGIASVKVLGISDQSFTNAVTRGSGEAGKQTNIFFLGQGLVTCDGTSHRYIDEVYVDNTRKRVEIGDYPIYSSCKELAVQIPTSWSDNQIKIKVNQSAFKSGQKAYVFVIGEDGKPGPAKEITIGEGGVTRVAPARPARMDGSMDGWMVGCFDVLGRSVEIRSPSFTQGPTANVILMIENGKVRRVVGNNQ